MNIDRDSVRNMLVREYNRWAGDYTGPINFGGDDDDDDSGGDDNGNGDEMDVDEGLRGMGLSSGSDESNGHGDKENENPDGDSGLARPAVARNAIPSPLSPTNKGFSDLDKENTGSNLNTAWQHIDGDTLTNNDTDGSAKKKSKTDMVPEHGTVEEGVKKNATMPNGSQDHSRTEDIDENTTMTTATEADLTNEDATSGAAEEEVPENKMSLIVKLKVDRGGNMDARSAYYERQRKAGKFWKRNVCVAKIQYTPGTQLPGYDKHGKALEPIGKK